MIYTHKWTRCTSCSLFGILCVRAPSFDTFTQYASTSINSCVTVVCGHNSARHQGGDGPVVVTESVVQELVETVHSAIDPSYQTAASSPRDGKTHSTGNYSQEDIALL